MSRQYLQRNLAGQKQGGMPVARVRPSLKQEELAGQGNGYEGAMRPELSGFRGLSQEIGGASNSPLVVQAKLKVGEPGDRYEREADAVAEQVMQQLRSPRPLLVGTDGDADNTPNIQPKPDIGSVMPSIGGIGVSAEIEAAINQAKGGGQPLESGLQRSMGQVMGRDFSRVRVHTDARADQLNRRIGARAFTTGQDVFFRQSLYRPDSPTGQQLIAHELTHVMQQQAGDSPRRVIQAAFESAYVHRRTRLHKKENDDIKGPIDNALHLEVGDQVKVDTNDAERVGNQQSGFWMPAKQDPNSPDKEGYIRQSKVVLASVIKGIDPTSPRKPEFSEDLSGSFSPIVDTGEASDRISSDSNSLSIASGVEGTLMNLLRLGAIARELYEDSNAWKKLSKEGLFDLATGGVSASAGLADASAKVDGRDNDLRDAAVASAVSGALSELKAVAVAGRGLVNIWTLYRAKRVDKSQGAIVTFQHLVGAAKSAAGIASSVYNVLNKTVPMSLFHTIPGLSLGVSLINLLISGGNAAGAYSSHDKMSKKSSELSTDLLKDLAESVTPQEDKAAIVFDMVSRGTGPTEQTYHRTKPDIRDGFAKLAEEEKTNGDEIKTKKRAAREQQKEVDRLKKEATAKSAEVDSQKGKIATTTSQLDDLMKQEKEKSLKAAELAEQEKKTRDQATERSAEASAEYERAETLAERAKTKNAEAKPMQEKIAEVHRVSGKADTLLGQALQLSLDAAQARKDAETASALANQAVGKSAALRGAAKLLQKQATALEEEASQLRTQFTLKGEALTTEQKHLTDLLRESTEADAAVTRAEAVAITAKSDYFAAYEPIVKAADGKGIPAFKGYKDTFKDKASNEVKTLFKDIDEYRNSLNPQKDSVDPNFEPIQTVHQTIQKYEFVDKMSEINFKRYRNGGVEFFSELISMVGDLTTLVAGVTGVGAIAGQTIKAVPAAYKLVKGAGGFIQKMYRDYGKTSSSKSSQVKHEEYVRHTHFIYGELAKAQTTDEVKEIKTLLGATGVDIGLWMEELGSKHPDKSVERMMLAMKQR